MTRRHLISQHCTVPLPGMLVCVIASIATTKVPKVPQDQATAKQAGPDRGPQATALSDPQGPRGRVFGRREAAGGQNHAETIRHHA